MAYKKRDIQDQIRADIESRGLSEKETPAAEPAEKSEAMPLFALRISQTDKDILTAYFRKRGLRLSQGIRNILSEFMLKQGLK